MEGEDASLRVFAKEASIPYRSLQDYLSGARMPGGEALQKLAKKGIDINWVLLGGKFTSNRPIIADTDYADNQDIFISDKEMDYALALEAAAVMDKAISGMISSSGRPLPFVYLKILHGDILDSLRTTYLRTIEAVPLLMEQKKMSKNDIASLLASAIEPHLQELTNAAVDRFSEAMGKLASER